MASLQRYSVRGHSYWRIVESRRVNGKPRIFVVAYLGKADDLLARLRSHDILRVRSRSHGDVAAFYSLATELELAGTIDRYLAKSGRRSREEGASPSPAVQPRTSGGLTVGQSLVLATIGRASHATSKRGFADWASSTTLGDITSFDVKKLTSQHFWDQMDQLPIESIKDIEAEIIGRAIKLFEIPLDTVLYDATNFFTFIASTNTKPTLAARGHNKQKRDDLRQIGVALLCSRLSGIPLWHQVYGGQISDAKCFAEVFPKFRQRLIDLGQNIESMTVVYDKGNVSQKNQTLVDNSKIHYVSALTVASQKKLVIEANLHLIPIQIGDESIMAFHTHRMVWGAERSIVVFISERLRQGQMRGILQQVDSTKKWLKNLADTLQRGKQKRDRGRIERDIERRLMGRLRLAQVLSFQLTGTDPVLRLDYQFNQKAFDNLSQEFLGRIVLMTDHHDWSASEIIRTYRGQSDVEEVFAHLKNPTHLAIRPQYHWTDQKLHVHVFTCMLAYLLAKLTHLRATTKGGYDGSMESLINELSKIRRTTAVRTKISGKGQIEVSTLTDEIDPEMAKLAKLLGVEL